MDENTDTGPGEGHNSQNMTDAEKTQLIKSTCAELDALEEQRAEISDQIKKLKHTNIKGKLGMKIADFNFARRLYSLDGNDRDQFLASIKTTFNALGVGDQLDFIAAMERAHGPANADDDDGYGDPVQQSDGPGTNAPAYSEDIPDEAA